MVAWANNRLPNSSTNRIGPTMLVLWVFLILAFDDLAKIQAQVKTRIATTVTLERKSKPLLSARGDLGKLDWNQEYLLTVTVVNSTKETVELTPLGIEKTNRTLILEPGESKDQVLEIHPTSNQPAGNRTLLFSSQAASLAAIIRLDYQVQGIVRLGTRELALLVADSERLAVAKVGLWTTAPITPEDLRLDVSDSLRDLPVRIETSDAGAHIYVAATVDDVSRGPISGTVQLKDRRNVTRASLRVSVQKHVPLQLAPNPIRFQPDRDRNELLTATVLVRRNPVPIFDALKGSDNSLTVSQPAQSREKERQGETSETPTEAVLDIKCFANSKQITLQQLRFDNTQLYQLNLQLPNTDASRHIEQLSWQINDGDRRYELVTEIFIGN